MRSKNFILFAFICSFLFKSSLQAYGTSEVFHDPISGSISPNAMVAVLLSKNTSPIKFNRPSVPWPAAGTSHSMMYSTHTEMFIPPQSRWWDGDSLGNLYAYAENNPGTYIDPLGLDVYWVGGAGDHEPYMGMAGPHGTVKNNVLHGYDPFSGNSPGALMNQTSGIDHYYGYNQEDLIIEKILDQRKLTLSVNPKKNKKTAYSEINLIGHSLGGVTALNVAKRLGEMGINVNTLITIDPVAGMERGFLMQGAPNNVNSWINVHQNQSLLDAIATIPFVGSAVALIPSLLSSGSGNTIATIGGQLGAERGANNISSNKAHSDFRGMINQLPSGTLKKPEIKPMLNLLFFFSSVLGLIFLSSCNSYSIIDDQGDSIEGALVLSYRGPFFNDAQYMTSLSDKKGRAKKLSDDAVTIILKKGYYPVTVKYTVEPYESFFNENTIVLKRLETGSTPEIQEKNVTIKANRFWKWSMPVDGWIDGFELAERATFDPQYIHTHLDGKIKVNSSKLWFVKSKYFFWDDNIELKNKKRQVSLKKFDSFYILDNAGSLLQKCRLSKIGSHSNSADGSFVDLHFDVIDLKGKNQKFIPEDPTSNLINGHLSWLNSGEFEKINSKGNYKGKLTKDEIIQKLNEIVRQENAIYGEPKN